MSANRCDSRYWTIDSDSPDRHDWRSLCICQRIVSMEADAIVAEAFEQFRFNRTRDRVVHSLVDARPYPSTARGYFRCLRHLPRAVIAEAELLKQAFVMKFLDGR
jgi:hypothetical protein